VADSQNYFLGLHREERSFEPQMQARLKLTIKERLPQLKS
jgi:hypothetical protein